MKVNLAPGLINEGSNYTTRVAQRIDLDAAIAWTSGTTTVAGAYSIQRDAAGTDHLQLNVPTGTGFKFSIAATEELIWTTGAFAFQQATTLSTTTGSLILAAGGTTAATFSGADVTFSGTVTIGSAEISEAELEILDGASVTTTELNLIDGDTARDTNAIADGDGVLINDAGTMHMTTVQTLATYMEGEINAFSEALTLSGAVDIQGGYANSGGAPYDGVVDAGGGGNWTTIQAGDDALDAGDFTMLVKGGTYAESPTISTNDATIVIEPGTDIQGVITLSGSNISLIFGSGCDIDGITITGSDCYIHGGGWDTISNGGTARDGLYITGSDNIVENIAVKTTGGGAANNAGIDIATGDRNVIKHCNVADSDAEGVLIASGATHTLLDGVFVTQSDGRGIQTSATQTRIIGCYVGTTGAGHDSIQLAGGAEDCVVVGCMVQNSGNVSIDITGTAEDCLVVGNRTDGGPSDASGTSTVASNETTAFS
jgi:hypothetical protein